MFVCIRYQANINVYAPVRTFLATDRCNSQYVHGEGWAGTGVLQPKTRLTEGLNPYLSMVYRIAYDNLPIYPVYERVEGSLILYIYTYTI